MLHILDMIINGSDENKKFVGQWKAYFLKEEVKIIHTQKKQIL